MKMLTRSRLRSRSAIVPSLCLAGLALAAQAQATCFNTKSLEPSGPAKASGHLVEAVYRADDSAGLRYTDFAPRTIVGLWQFQWSGFANDWGTQAWHSDGTELTFSVGQNPATGDVCQGAWEQVGPRTYVLNHIAMGWAAPGADPTQGAQFLRVHLRFLVTLDPSGNKFTGKYTANVYLESKSEPFNEDPNTNPPIASGTGSVTATRVSPDANP